MLDFHKGNWGSSPVWDSYFKNVVWARGLEHLSVFRLEETLTKKEKEKTDEQVFKLSVLGVNDSLDSLEVKIKKINSLDCHLVPYPPN